MIRDWISLKIWSCPVFAGFWQSQKMEIYSILAFFFQTCRHCGVSTVLCSCKMAPLSYLTFESRHLSCNLAPDRRVSYIFWASLWISYICSFATDYARPAYLKSQQYITISCRIISYQIKSDHYLSYRIAFAYICLAYFSFSLVFSDCGSHGTKYNYAASRSDSPSRPQNLQCFDIVGF